MADGWRWTPIERKLEKAEVKIADLEGALVAAETGLDSGLMFLRAVFESEEPVSIAPEIYHSICTQMEIGLAACKHKRL